MQNEASTKPIIRTLCPGETQISLGSHLASLITFTVLMVEEKVKRDAQDD